MFNFEWHTKDEIICDINEWKSKFALVYEFIVSPDGEKIAAPVEIEDKKVTLCVNGKIWENTFERVCYPQFTNKGNLLSLVLQNYEWCLAKDDTVLEESFDYAWNLTSDESGDSIAFNIKKGDFYGACLNGKVWENLFFDARDLILSRDGQKTASYVRVKNPQLLDIFSFKEGVWTLAINGNGWNRNFISIYGACFSPDSEKVAATVRLSQQEFTVAVNGNLWNETFLNAWEPVFLNNDDVCVPVKTTHGWTLAVNGKPIWKNYNQLWHPRINTSGKIAAVVSTEFGKWTISVDDKVWEKEFSQAVLPPFFSPDGKRVASVIRHKDLWTVAIDGEAWNVGFDRIWTPTFSPDSKHCIAKAEKDGVYFIVLDGKIGKDVFDMLWEPIFSPNGDKILLRFIKNGKYVRKIISIHEVFR